eukprot:m51a1_g6310 putative camp-specific 3 -cyclic phosphodiesterase 4d-like protein (837) ;mRNA; r:322798-325851
MESTVLQATFKVETIYADITTESLAVATLPKMHLKDFTYLDGAFPLVVDIGPNRMSDAWLSCDALDPSYSPDPLLVAPFEGLGSSPRCWCHDEWVDWCNSTAAVRAGRPCFSCETACDFLWGMEASQLLDPLARPLVIKYPFTTAWLWSRGVKNRDWGRVWVTVGCTEATGITSWRCINTQATPWTSKSRGGYPGLMEKFKTTKFDQVPMWTDPWYLAPAKSMAFSLGVPIRWRNGEYLGGFYTDLPMSDSRDFFHNISTVGPYTFWIVMVNERGQVIGAADEALAELWGAGECANYMCRVDSLAPELPAIALITPAKASMFWEVAVHGEHYFTTHQPLSLGWSVWFFVRTKDVDLSGGGGDHAVAIAIGVVIPVSAVLVAAVLAVAIVLSRRGGREKKAKEQRNMDQTQGRTDALSLPAEDAIRTLSDVQRKGALPQGLQQDVSALEHLIATNELYKAGRGLREKVRGLGLDRDTGDYLIALLTVDERPEVALSSTCTGDENDVPGAVCSPDHTGTQELAGCIDSAGPSAFESWDYDVCDIEVPAGATLLEAVGMAAVERQGLVSALGLDRHRVRAFLRAVDRTHNPALQFHNSTHAADAVQAVHALLSGSRVTFTPVERLAALVACAAHDMAHPGVGNAFLRATLDPLAASCGAGAGAIESSSSAEAVRLLQSADAGLAVGSKVGTAAALELREAVAELVRCTDLARHLEVTAMLGARAATGGLDPQSPADRLLALRALVKAADVSRAARKWAVCERWARRAMEELRAQGERERSAGLKASPFADGGVADTAKCQAAFTRYVARPLAELLQPLCPDVARVMLSNLVANAANWEQ